MELKPIDKIDNLEDAMFYASSGVGAAASNCPEAIAAYIDAQTFITEMVALSETNPEIVKMHVEEAKQFLRQADTQCDQTKAG